MIVYRLISPSGKSYIGITSKPFKHRFSQHVTKWKNKAYSCKLFNAFDKYPPDLWTHEILFEGNKEETQQKEIEYIKLYRTQEDDFGYNILPGGELSRLGLKNSDEWREKFLEKMKGRPRPPFTDEWKANLSKAHLGEKHPPERVEKNRINHMGKPGKASPLKGRKISEEHRIKIINATIERSKNPEFIEKLRKAIKEGWRVRKLKNVGAP